MAAPHLPDPSFPGRSRGDHRVIPAPARDRSLVPVEAPPPPSLGGEPEAAEVGAGVGDVQPARAGDADRRMYVRIQDSSAVAPLDEVEGGAPHASVTALQDGVVLLQHGPTQVLGRVSLTWQSALKVIACCIQMAESELGRESVSLTLAAHLRKLGVGELT